MISPKNQSPTQKNPSPKETLQKFRRPPNKRKKVRSATTSPIFVCKNNTKSRSNQTLTPEIKHLNNELINLNTFLHTLHPTVQQNPPIQPPGPQQSATAEQSAAHHPSAPLTPRSPKSKEIRKSAPIRTPGNRGLPRSGSAFQKNYNPSKKKEAYSEERVSVLTELS